MEYWKPEHPPPTTPIRSPAGTGVWVAIISRTLLIAAGVSVTGVVEAGAPTTTSGVTVAVDIGKSPCLFQTSLVYAPATTPASPLSNTMQPNPPPIQPSADNILLPLHLSPIKSL